MGFLNKMMGLGGRKSAANKQKIREIFNAKVQDGDSYTVLAAMNMVIGQEFLEEIYIYYNYIIGYKDGNDPEFVLIPTDKKLSAMEDPVHCKRSECREAKYLEQTGSFTLTHPGFGDNPIDFGVIASTAWDGDIIDVSYVDEYMPFMEFYRKRFVK